MNLIRYWLFSILFVNPYFNNIGFCQNNMTVSELENINGLGKPKAKVFKFDSKTNVFNGVAYFKRNVNRAIDADSLEYEKYIQKRDAISKKIKSTSRVTEKVDRGIFSKDGKYYVSVDDPDGYVNSIMFFNSNGILLNKYKVDKPFMVSYDFNAFGNYFMLWGSVSGEFYFFTATGKFVRKGNFNSFTKDPGTSYWKNEISKSGKNWVLINNNTFIYDERNNLIDKLPTIDFAIIYENQNYILYVKNHTIYIYNYQTHLIEYISTYTDCTSINISNGNLYLLINDKIWLEYEISL